MQFLWTTRTERQTVCDIKHLPVELQGADASLVGKLILDALNGNFPTSPESSNALCPVLSTTHRGRHCTDENHTNKAVPIQAISCFTTFHFLESFECDIDIEIWYGIQSNSVPVPRPALHRVKEFFEEHMSP